MGWTFEFQSKALGLVKYDAASEEWTVDGSVEGRMAAPLAETITEILHSGAESTPDYTAGAMAHARSIIRDHVRSGGDDVADLNMVGQAADLTGAACILCGGCGLAVAPEAMIEANDPSVTLDGHTTSWPCPACYPPATQHKRSDSEGGT